MVSIHGPLGYEPNTLTTAPLRCGKRPHPRPGPTSKPVQRRGPCWCGALAGARKDVHTRSRTWVVAANDVLTTRRCGPWLRHLVCSRSCNAVSLHVGLLSGRRCPTRAWSVKRAQQRRRMAHGVVVSHPLSMGEALGSIPSVSTRCPCGTAPLLRARVLCADKSRQPVRATSAASCNAFIAQW